MASLPAQAVPEALSAEDLTREASPPMFELNRTATALSFSGGVSAGLSFLHDPVVSITAKAIHTDEITFTLFMIFELVKK
jgi:hypothetical protein